MTYDEWKTTEPTHIDYEERREQYEEDQEYKFMKYFEYKE